MSGTQVHHIGEQDDVDPTPDHAISGLAWDLTDALGKIGSTLAGIEDELNRWRNGQFVGESTEATCRHNERTIMLDEYGRAPIVHVLVESVPGLVRHGGKEYDVIAYAVDANGDTWPMVRSATSPRPYLVRDYEGLEQ